MGTTVIKCTIGMPGAGKSYSRVRWILDTYLPEEHGIIFTNLPLNIDKIASYLGKKGFCEETIKSRIQLIPDDVLKRWKTFDDKGLPLRNPEYKEGYQNEADLSYNDINYEFLGPWHYFQNHDLGGAHIMIDEIQKFVDNRSSQRVKKLWGNWLSTIRHEGCTIEFMTQTALRIPNEIKTISESTIEIVPNSEQKFPFLPIKNYDYYQLAKKFLGEDFKSSTCTEWGVAENAKKKILDRRKYRFNPFFFKFYDSYNNEEKGGSGKRKLEEWEKYNHFQLLAWFFKRNFFPVILIFVYSYLGFMLLFGDGFNKLLHVWQGNQKEKVFAMEAKKNDMTVEQYRQHLFKEEIKEEISQAYEQKLSDLQTVIENNQVLETVAENTPIQITPPPPKQKALRLTFLSPRNDYCILSDNKTYFVGDMLEDKRLTNIDFKTRRILFDDETILSY